MPVNKPPFHPQPNATINTGIIANEIEPPCAQILNFKNGIISKTSAKAVKIATSIKNKVRFDRELINDHSPPHSIITQKSNEIGRASCRERVKIDEIET